VGDLRQHLLAAGRRVVALDVALARAVAENREAPDFKFAPLADRLARIFDIEPTARARLDDALCQRFLAPIFAVARPYDDAHSTLEDLRARGYRTAIVSNSPWGSPPALWRSELQRLRLASLVDAVVLCGDVGWRKPSLRIFEHTCTQLGVRSTDCVFVGDDLEWDVAGSAAAGMRPVLIDRAGRHAGFTGLRIRDLNELVAALVSPT
jgi:putative hydrolase of the HAD superfamily